MLTTYTQTKIIATLGPASNTREALREMIKNGVDTFRLNASHGKMEDHQRMIDIIRALNKEEGYNIGILLDLQGPKIRIGTLEAPIPIKPGDIIQLDNTIDKLTDGRIPIQYDTFARDVNPGDLVLVEDGKIYLEVVASDGKAVVDLRVKNGTQIGSRKGVNLPYTNVSIPSVTDKDTQDLVLAIRNDLEWVALSFVRSPEDVHLLRQILREANCDARIIAKIEKPEAVKVIDEIIEATDAIMIARGDLGVEIPIEDVPFEQKRIVRKCIEKSRPVIVATQMLESMIEVPRPTRAEATDVVNAVLDGADTLMLSGETSVGRHPAEVVRVMHNLISKAEQEEAVYNRYLQADKNSRTYYANAVNLAAVQLAEETGAKAIVGMTSSGYTAFELSKHRPKANIFIFTDNRTMINTLNLVWGVRAFYYDSYVGTDETIRDVIRILKDRRLVAPGDVVVNTASMPIHARKRTNMVKLTVVE